jgi:hypothetical protein
MPETTQERRAGGSVSKWTCDDCGTHIYGADPVEHDEDIDTHVRGHDNEDDPGASDLGGTRTGAEQDQNHQQEEQPVNKTTTHDTGETTGVVGLVVAYVGKAEHPLPLQDERELRITYLMERPTGDTITYTTDAAVQVLEDIKAPAVARDDERVRQRAAELIAAGQFPVGERFGLWSTWDNYGIRDEIVPAPFEGGPGEPWSGLAGDTIEHLSSENRSASGSVEFTASILMATGYADWTRDAEAEPVTNVVVKTAHGDAVMFSPSGEEMRRLAAFFSAEADRLDDAQQSVTAAKARARDLAVAA